MIDKKAWQTDDTRGRKKTDSKWSYELHGSSEIKLILFLGFFLVFFSFWIKILTRKKNWGKRQKNGRKPFPLLIKKLERKQIEFLHCTTKKSSQRHKDKVLTSVYTQIHMHITSYVLKFLRISKLKVWK